MEEEIRVGGAFEEEDLSNSSFYSDENNTIFSPPLNTSSMFLSSWGVWLAVPEWEAALTALSLSLIISLTLVGNVLVILSVFTYRPLRSAPNFYIVSLAVADMTVAVLVLPFNVLYLILGRWVLGKLLCEFWLTCDIYCCTNSILHLCVIAVDRYRAITDPVNYARKRTLHRVFVTVAAVWITSLLISSPPILGWNDWPPEFTPHTPCTLTSERGYIIYSSLGSFFLPLLLMTAIYIRIFIATRRRLRQRARASRLSALGRGNGTKNGSKNEDGERSSVSSVEEGKEERRVKRPKKKRRRKWIGKAEPRSLSGHKDDKGGSRRSLKGVETPPTALTDLKLSPANMSEDSVTDAEIALPSSSLPKPCIKKPKTLRLPSAQVTQFVEEKARISLSKERKAARTLGIIMGVFVVCWLPFFLMYVILPFCDNCVRPSSRLTNFITWLGYVNSSLNPIIYTIFNMDFRKAFKKLLHLDK